MVSVTISVGSNYGDRYALVENAVAWLKSILMQSTNSSIYETPCALKEGKPYVNTVIKGFYSGDAFQLEDELKDKEIEMGRNAERRQKGEVPIDMDIVLLNGDIVKSWDYKQKFFRIGFSEIS